MSPPPRQLSHTAADAGTDKSESSDTSTASSPMPPPKLPSVITPSLLAQARSHTQLPKHTWYVISSVTLSALNRPDEIPKVFRDAVGLDGDGVANGSTLRHEEQLRVARRMREGLVKSAAVVGLPRTINALLALKASTPDDLLDHPTSPSASLRTVDVYDTPTSTVLQRGETFFNKVYGKISKRVMGQMDRSGTEDLGVTARLMYGYLLSNTRILSAAESSFVLIAGLVPQDVNPQLKGHLRGAINNGATVEEVRAVRDVAIRICESSGMRRIGESELGGWGWREDVANL